MYDQYDNEMTEQSVEWSATNMEGNNNIDKNTELLTLHNFSKNQNTVTARIVR